jgi:hypothetical protein
LRRRRARGKRGVHEPAVELRSAERRKVKAITQRRLVDAALQAVIPCAFVGWIEKVDGRRDVFAAEVLEGHG